jgi:hypothetical protein
VCAHAGAGAAALLGVGVFGMGLGYMTEAQRVEYSALSAGPLGDEVHRSGLAGGANAGGVGAAAAPAGTF